MLIPDTNSKERINAETESLEPDSVGSEREINKKTRLPGCGNLPLRLTTQRTQLQLSEVGVEEPQATIVAGLPPLPGLSPPAMRLPRYSLLSHINILSGVSGLCSDHTGSSSIVSPAAWCLIPRT